MSRELWQSGSEQQLRQDIVEVGRRMYARGFAPAADGNISARLSSELILITPTGLCKGYLSPEQLLVVDLHGNPIPSDRSASQDLKPSSETPMHVEVYRQRPDVGAVIHAHPPMSVACTIAGVSLEKCVLPEVISCLGGIPTAEYATPSTAANADVVRPLIRDYDALLLTYHGALAVGCDVYEAFMRLEQVEHAATVTLAALQFGEIRPLAEGEVEKLRAMGKRA